MKGEAHGNHSIDHCDSALGRGATCLAVQFRLGILAQRRPRLDSINRYYSRFNGTDRERVFSRKRACLQTARTRRAFRYQFAIDGMRHNYLR